MKKFTIQWLGLTIYNNALTAQNRRVDMVKSGKDPFILGCEHPTVVTFGRRCLPEQELKTPKEDLKKFGISIVQVPRGGQATFHMPGQLVIYPILNIKDFNLGVKDYVQLLMAVTSQVLANRGISTVFVTKTPGLYSDRGKICFCGIRVQKGISSHGLALNVNNNLDFFKHIRSCGKDREDFDSLSKRGINAQCHEVFEDWINEFKRALGIFSPEDTVKNPQVTSFALTEIK